MGMLRKYASSRRTTLLSLSAVQRRVVFQICWSTLLEVEHLLPSTELPTKGRSSDAQDFMDLFDQHRRQLAETEALAARMRPRTLDEFIGQDQMIGPGRLLRRAIIADQLSSHLYGPPGTGKTTLARVIANTTRAHFT